MIVSVKFPIRNQVRVLITWPIKVGSKIYFLESADGLAKAVGVNFTGIPAHFAPTFEAEDSASVKATLKLKSDNYTLKAERDLRGWQSLLITYVPFDIDFDSPTEEFQPENDADRDQIKVHNFSRSKAPIPWRSTEYAILGRAFLGIEKGIPQIELMSLYREGLFALFAERSIDAYNSFYLFIESQFCRGKTATNQAVDALMNSPDFMSALTDVMQNAKASPKLSRVRFEALMRGRKTRVS